VTVWHALNLSFLIIMEFKMAHQRSGLTNNQLKIIAIISMTIDHVGYILFPQYIIFRIIGRLAFPIFAYMIAEGYRHTRNRKRYFWALLVSGVVFQVIYLIFKQSWYMNILFTFSLSLITLLCISYFYKKRNILSLLLLIFEILFVVFISCYLPNIINGFKFDYGLPGILLPVFIYLLPNKWLKLTSLGLTVLFMSYYNGWVVLFALFSIPLLWFYNGKRGKTNLKYLFYIFYPTHFIIIYLIYLIVKQ
jgi:hypothetical protein